MNEMRTATNTITKQLEEERKKLDEYKEGESNITAEKQQEIEKLQLEKGDLEQKVRSREEEIEYLKKEKRELSDKLKTSGVAMISPEILAKFDDNEIIAKLKEDIEKKDKEIEDLKKQSPGASAPG